MFLNFYILFTTQSWFKKCFHVGEFLLAGFLLCTILSRILKNFPEENPRSSALCRRLTAKYNFEKPNDRRALDLMNAAAAGVMKELPDLVMGYGISDEFRCARQL